MVGQKRTIVPVSSVIASDRAACGTPCARADLTVNLAISLITSSSFCDRALTTGDAHAVQTAGDLYRIVKFTARVQNGHDHFRRRDAFFRVNNTGRNATAIIRYDTELSA